MTYSITQKGKPLDEKLYKFDENTKTFSSNEDNLVLDFSNINGCTFNTGYGCTFRTGSECLFNTGDGCTFKTGPECLFRTGLWCTFDTGLWCTFDTGDGCTFNTGPECLFRTGDGCTFNTGDGCTFDTGDGCTFRTGLRCTIIRRDIYEVIELKENQTIKLNGYGEKGFVVEEIEEPNKADSETPQLPKKIKDSTWKFRYGNSLALGGTEQWQDVGVSMTDLKNKINAIISYLEALNKTNENDT